MLPCPLVWVTGFNRYEGCCPIDLQGPYAAGSACPCWHNSRTAASTKEFIAAVTPGDNSVLQSVFAGCTPSSTTAGCRCASTRRATSRSDTPSWCTLLLPGKEFNSSPDIRTTVPGAFPTSTASITIRREQSQT